MSGSGGAYSLSRASSLSFPFCIFHFGSAGGKAKSFMCCCKNSSCLCLTATHTCTDWVMSWLNCLLGYISRLQMGFCLEIQKSRKKFYNMHGLVPSISVCLPVTLSLSIISPLSMPMCASISRQTIWATLPWAKFIWASWIEPNLFEPHLLCTQNALIMQVIMWCLE